MKTWTKGFDLFDNSPRYTFDGRDPSNALAYIRVVIIQETEEEYVGGPKVKRYYGMVENIKNESRDSVGPFKLLSLAKSETEKLFDEYARLYPNDI